MLPNFLFPLVFTVVKQPLVTEGNNARLTSSSNDFLFRLVVRDSHSIVNHLLSNNWLSYFNFLTGRDSDLHHTLGETLLIAQVLCFFESVNFLVRLDFGLLDGELSTQVAHSWYVNEGNRIKALDPLKFDAHTLTKTLLFLKVSQHSVVIWSIRWHTSHNGCSFVHADCGKRKDVDMFVRGHRCLTLLSNKILTHDCGQTWVLEINFSHLLMSEVTR